MVLSKEDQEKIKTLDIAKGIMTLGFAPREKVVKPEHNLRPCWLMRPDDKKAKNSSTTFRAFHKVRCLLHGPGQELMCSVLRQHSYRRVFSRHKVISSPCRAWTLWFDARKHWCKTRVLWQVLKDKDQVAICCIRKRANDAPRLHALMPQSEVRQDRDILAPEGFHVIPLPFADDMSMSPPLLSLSLCAHARVAAWQRSLTLACCVLLYAMRDVAPGNLPPGFSIS